MEQKGLHTEEQKIISARAASVKGQTPETFQTQLT
jgi:hypothetical protein